jgi:hypothetical protein
LLHREDPGKSPRERPGLSPAASRRLPLILKERRVTRRQMLCSTSTPDAVRQLGRLRGQVLMEKALHRDHFVPSAQPSTTDQLLAPQRSLRCVPMNGPEHLQQRMGAALLDHLVGAGEQSGWRNGRCRGIIRPRNRRRAVPARAGRLCFWPAWGTTLLGQRKRRAGTHYIRVHTRWSSGGVLLGNLQCKRDGADRPGVLATIRNGIGGATLKSGMTLTRCSSRAVLGAELRLRSTVPIYPPASLKLH